MSLSMPLHVAYMTVRQTFTFSLWLNIVSVNFSLRLKNHVNLRLRRKIKKLLELVDIQYKMTNILLKKHSVIVENMLVKGLSKVGNNVALILRYS